MISGTMPTSKIKALQLVAPADWHTIDGYRLAGAALMAKVSGLQWDIGDWLLWGKNHYSNVYQDIAEQLGIKPQTARLYSMVADRYPPLNRFNNLSWTHHQVAAGIANAAERQRVLSLAADQQWPVTRLRKEIRQPLIETAGQDLLTDDQPQGNAVTGLHWKPVSSDPAWDISLLVSLNDYELTGFIGDSHMISVVPISRDTQYAFVALTDLELGHQDYTKRGAKRSALALMLYSLIPAELRSEPITWTEVKRSNGIESSDDLLDHILPTTEVAP